MIVKIRMAATMSKLLTAFGDGIGSSSRDVPESDFAAMDGGSFYIGAGNRALAHVKSFEHKIK